MAKLTYGLVGHPVKHSLSPAMHAAAFKELGVDAEYLLYDVEPENLEKFLDSAVSKKIAGLNVTIPHKIHAKEYLEKRGSLDENAKRLGAVNTIKVTESGGLCGYNTDGPGFYRSLVEELKCEPEGKTVFVLGSGGAATAIVMYLGNGPKEIFIYDVEEKKAGDLASRYKGYYGRGKVALVETRDIKEKISVSDILVNATSIGMKDSDPSPVDKSFLRPGMYVYDLVYNRPTTTLVKDAMIRKCYAATGLGMLLYQGAIAFEIWTGERAPVAVMRRALKEAVKGNV